MNFSANLQQCKEKRGLTIEEFSRLSGVPVGTLSKLLSGAIAEPKVSVALALARGLGCPLESLLDPAGEYVAQTLNDDERTFLVGYRKLDRHSRELLRLVMDKQLSLTSEDTSAPENTEKTPRRAVILQTPKPKAAEIPLFDLPVSAGTGSLLDGDSAEMMTLPDGYPEGKADFALRISGNSMEPRFRSGDILLIHRQDTVESGELGIFLADGEGYFKRFMGTCLHSLNPAYADIPLSGFRDVRCVGHVVGRMTRR